MRRALALAPVVVAVFLTAVVAYVQLGYAAAQADGRDVSAYWEAALRLRAGEPLYVPGAANESDLYRYAPWFAYAWIPLTFLPHDAVLMGWVALMVAASVLSTAPLLRRGLAGACAFALLTPFQLEGAAYGNVQPLLVLMLVWGVERRSGPLWIAIGASLKAVPAVLALVYLARGEWRRAVVTVALTALLTAPMLLHDLSGYSTQPGAGQLSLVVISPALYLVAAVAASVAIFPLARSRFAWLAGGVAVAAWLPRFLTYEIGFVLVGAAGSWSRDLALLRARLPRVRRGRGASAAATAAAVRRDADSGARGSEIAP